MAFTLEGRLYGKLVKVSWDDGDLDAGTNTGVILDLVESLDGAVETPDGELIEPGIDDPDVAYATLLEVLDDVELIDGDLDA